MENAVEVYARPGSHVGFDSSSAGWELIGSFSRLNNDSSDYDTFALPRPLEIPAGDTMGIYAYSSVGGLRHDDRTGPETWADDNLSLGSTLRYTIQPPRNDVKTATGGRFREDSHGSIGMPS